MKSLTALLVSLLCFACDSTGSSSKPRTSTDDEKQSTSTTLARPDQLERAPGRGLPPELKPPR